MEQKRKFVNEIGQSSRGPQCEGSMQRVSMNKISLVGMGCWNSLGSSSNDRIN